MTRVSPETSSSRRRPPSHGDHRRPARAADTVRIGYIGDFNGAEPRGGRDQPGSGPAQGLQPDLEVFTNGPIQIQAFGSGSLDFGYVGPGALWLPASGRAKVIAIDDLGQADRVMARAGIRTMTELKGKKVGVPEGTSGDMLLRLALRKQGMRHERRGAHPHGPEHGRGGLRQWADRRGRHLVSAGQRDQERAADMVELAKNADFFLRSPSPPLSSRATTSPTMDR